MLHRYLYILFLCVNLLGSSIASAAPDRLTIIIDDIGYHLVNGLRSTQLPAPVTLAIIPYTPHSVSLADAAHLEGKELMLHLPMSSTNGRAMEAGTLTSLMAKSEFKQNLNNSIKAVPYIQGVNNHMGSKLTEQAEPMQWVMEELEGKPLYFIDSRTSANSQAYEIAKQHAIPTLKRDIFLDNQREPQAILEQLNKAVLNAKRNGYAIAIGHPYPETLKVLEQQLPKLQQQGIQIVPASALLNGRLQLPLATYVVEFP